NAKLCFNCFKPGHRARTCPEPCHKHTFPHLSTSRNEKGKQYCVNQITLKQKNNIIYLRTTVHLANSRTTKHLSLLDSGAAGLYIDPSLVEQWDLATKPLDHPITVINADGSTNDQGKATHNAILHVTIDG
ncbi:hypothetical protein P691DRAFT_689346, partial [Macrolepiota fuliginosa MF-IS2]